MDAELIALFNLKIVKDECSSNSQSCDVNAVCSNAKGTYTCICKAGYFGDGRTCSGIVYFILHYYFLILSSLKFFKVLAGLFLVLVK